MATPLRIASIAFHFAFLVAVPSLIISEWTELLASGRFTRIITTSIIVLVAAGFYILVSDALIRIKTTQQSPTPPDNE